VESLNSGIDMILEIATHSLFSALAAQNGGADRIELCMALDMGGLSPSPGLLQMVRDRIRIPIQVLIRPRAGGFVYAEPELDTMLSTVRYCKALGVDGIVTGCLTPDNYIDAYQMDIIKQEAGSMDMTFHRAFDFLKSPVESLQVLSRLGISRVLTSGQAETALAGRDLIRTLILEDSDVTIMPGAGINSNNIIELADYTMAVEFHGSAKKTMKAATNISQKDLNYFGDWRQQETSEHEVLLLKSALTHLQSKSSG
jgi:copper homeostasis protein